MKRDFSNSSKQKILSAVRQVEKERFADIYIWFGNNYGIYQQWVSKLGLQTYINRVDSYRNKVIQKNSAAEHKIKRVFEIVEDIDNSSQRKLAKIKESLEKWDAYILELNGLIHPADISEASFNIMVSKILDSGKVTATPMEDTEDFLDFLSGLTKKAGKYGKDEQLSLTSSIISYFSTLCGLATEKNKSGTDIASQLLSLFRSSAGVENGIYQYYEKTLHPYEAIKLDGKAGTTMAWLSMLSSLASVADEGIETYKIFVAPDSTSGEKIAQSIKIGGAVFDFGGKAYISSQAANKVLQVMSKTEKPGKIVNQILSTNELEYATSAAAKSNISKANVVLSLAAVATSTVSSGVERYDEVSADGKVDVIEGSSIAVHASLSGLETTCSLLTLGVVNFDGEEVADELETEVTDFVNSESWAANFIKDTEHHCAASRFLVSVGAGAVMVGKKAIKGTTETLDKVFSVSPVYQAKKKIAETTFRTIRTLASD